ncbi:lectin-like domain-containing protein, partial [Lactiplantibacillus plantarum]
EKNHYKMYKSGKRWVFSCITSIGLTTGVILTFNPSIIHADTVKTSTIIGNVKADSLSNSQVYLNKSETAVRNSTKDSKVASSSSTADSQATSTNSTKDSKVASSSSTADSQATSTNSTKDSKVASSSSTADSQATSTNTTKDSKVASSSSTADSQATSTNTTKDSKVTNSSSTADSQATSTNSAKDSKIASSSSSESVKTVSKNSVKSSAPKIKSYKKTDASKTHTLSEKKQITISSSTANGEVIVTPENFLQYFKLNGQKKDKVGAWIPTYDASTGIITLTQDEGDEVGLFTLKNKINTSSSFSLVGEINIGSHAQPYGADGIGIGFQPGNTDLVGSHGSALGFGGLSNSFGWKADTFWNGTTGATDSGSDPDDMIDPNKTGHDFGGNGFPFGAFVYTDTDNIAQTYNGTDAPAQKIDQPGVFQPIKINYDGDSKTMSVYFDGKIWSKDVSSWIAGNTFQSFFINASTGGFSNLQQFKIISFDYTAAGVVNIHYQDQDGKTIHPDATQISGAVGDSYDTSSAKIDIDGYTFVASQGPVTGQYTTDPIDVTFIYHKTGTLVQAQKISRTINYLDKKTGKVVANQVVQDVTFNRTAIVDKVTGELLGYDTTGDG